LENIQGQKLSYGTPNCAWLSLELLEVLCSLAEMGHVGSVRALLELPLKHCPELLVLGLAQIKVFGLGGFNFFRGGGIRYLHQSQYLFEV
jgi:hypothetical protein